MCSNSFLEGASLIHSVCGTVILKLCSLEALIKRISVYGRVMTVPALPPAAQRAPSQRTSSLSQSSHPSERSGSPQRSYSRRASHQEPHPNPCRPSSRSLRQLRAAIQRSRRKSQRRENQPTKPPCPNNPARNSQAHPPAGTTSNHPTARPKESPPPQVLRARPLEQQRPRDRKADPMGLN